MHGCVLFLFLSINIQHDINLLFIFSKIVDSVELMTSAEQIAEYVRMFR